MHCLEVIIARNAQAAGREAGHADTDGDDRLASAINAAASALVMESASDVPDSNDLTWTNFVTGYLSGRKEG